MLTTNSINNSLNVAAPAMVSFDAFAKGNQVLVAALPMLLAYFAAFGFGAIGALTSGLVGHAALFSPCAAVASTTGVVAIIGISSGRLPLKPETMIIFGALQGICAGLIG